MTLERRESSPETVIHSFRASRRLRAEVTARPVFLSIHSDIPQTIYPGTLRLVDRRGRVYTSKDIDDVSNLIFSVDKEDSETLRATAEKLLRQIYPK